MGNKIIAVGPHYKSALNAKGLKSPHPLKLFLKPFSSIITENHPIKLESFMREVVAEGEIALKLKKDLKNVEAADINLSEIIDSVTIGLDITLLDEDAFCFGKLYDTFTPLGKFSYIDPKELNFKIYLNDLLMQEATVNDMGINFEYLLAYCSNYCSLEKGDIILTGTPAGTFPIKSGDSIEIESNLLKKFIFKVK